MGQQRFTDMEARVTVFLQDVDIPTLFGQQGRNGRTSRASSHDEDVAGDGNRMGLASIRMSQGAHLPE